MATEKKCCKGCDHPPPPKLAAVPDPEPVVEAAPAPVEPEPPAEAPAIDGKSAAAGERDDDDF
jgi:hypothetical protein